ncbi:MAG: VOC family protein [Kangiellaceae bacterium]|nr:VOC family protein [Kangiellaceae bacterium]
MSDSEKKIGAIEWCDLTIDAAEQVKDFYSEVVGWKTEPLSMGDYDDYCANQPEDNKTVAGICHARGPNKNMPAQWLMYVRVASVADSAEKCVAAGGEVIECPRSMGSSQLCVIKDPAGAVLALVSD